MPGVGNLRFRSHNKVRRTMLKVLGYSGQVFKIIGIDHADQFFSHFIDFCFCLFRFLQASVGFFRIGDYWIVNLSLFRIVGIVIVAASCH